MKRSSEQTQDCTALISHILRYSGLIILLTANSNILENLFCSGTFQNMLDHIAKPALENAELLLSARVTGINTTDDNKVEVILDRRAALSFDEIVVTVISHSHSVHFELTYPIMRQPYGSSD